MKFNEKLIELRRKQGLSQEELGYKLNVTRQTVSKWELGQTTPEMEKLTEMSRLFNVSVDELINDSEITSNVNPIIEDQPITNKAPRDKKILIIIVIALIVVIISIGVKMFSAFSALNMFDKVANEALGAQEELLGEEPKNFFEKIWDMIFNGFNEIDVQRFNGTLELSSGTNLGMSVKNLLDEIITSNKTNDRKITVKYNEIETQDTTEIKNLKMELNEFDKFEVSFEYDKDRYIYEVTIEKYENNNVINEVMNNVKDNVINQNNEEDDEIFNQMDQFMKDTMNQFNY